MSKFESQSDDTVIRCPYCQYAWQPETEDFPNEDERDDECGECGKKFVAYVVYDVTYHTKPCCTLNGETHEYVQLYGRKRCEICGHNKTCNADNPEKEQSK